MSITTSTWNDRLKSAVGAIESKIPYVGGLLKAMTELFWPSSKVDIWSLVEEQVVSVVDSKILSKELEERQEEISGIKDTLEAYTVARNHEKGALMATMLGQVHVLFRKLTESSNNIHLIPLTVVLAHLHLALLRERFSHGQELYDENNSDVWHDELVEAYDTYRSFFRSIYPQWKKWRVDQIEIDLYTSKKPTTVPPFFYWVAHGKVLDHVTDTHLGYEDDWNSNSDYFEKVCEAIRDRLRNRAVADMAATLSSTFRLNAYLPNRENDPPEVDPALASFRLGPFSLATLGREANGAATTNIDDRPGCIERIEVREWNSIDGIQFRYSDHDGNFVGNPKGGKLHDIEVDDGRHVIGFRLRFAKGILCLIEVVFSDGTTSGRLGNRSDWLGPEVEAVVDRSYRLVSGSFRQGSGPSNTKGTSVIELELRHASLDCHGSSEPR